MDLEHPLFVNLTYAITSFSDYNGNALDRAVFADIAQFANRYGVSYPTTRSIAARIGRRREEVSKSVNRLKAKGFLTITKAKKGLDRHSRNVYHIAERFIRRRPDKRSKHFSASKWQRWCEIGRKRAITIKLKQKKTGTILDTAAEMASKQTTQPVQLTASQARKAREQRGGGFAGFGGVLAGLFPTASAPVQAVKDDYSQQVPRGGWSQALREHEAQQAAALQTVPTIPATPMTTTPTAQAPTDTTKQRERKAQAYDELQPLRERLRQQGTASSQAPSDGTARAVQGVARDYARASRPAVMASPWADPAPLQSIQQSQATPDMEQEAASAWLAGMKDVQRQAVRDVRKMASQRAGYAAEPSSRRGIVRL